MIHRAKKLPHTPTRPVLLLSDDPHATAVIRKLFGDKFCPGPNCSFFGSFGDSVFLAISPDKPQLVILLPMTRRDLGRIVGQVHERSRNAAILLLQERFVIDEDFSPIAPDLNLLVVPEPWKTLQTIVEQFLSNVGKCLDLRRLLPLPDIKPQPAV